MMSAPSRTRSWPALAALAIGTFAIGARGADRSLRLTLVLASAAMLLARRRVPPNASPAAPTGGRDRAP
jgi:hypothetical protein